MDINLDLFPESKRKDKTLEALKRLLQIVDAQPDTPALDNLRGRNTSFSPTIETLSYLEGLMMDSTRSIATSGVKLEGIMWSWSKIRIPELHHKIQHNIVELQRLKLSKNEFANESSWQQAIEEIYNWMYKQIEELTKLSIAYTGRIKLVIQNSPHYRAILEKSTDKLPLANFNVAAGPTPFTPYGSPGNPPAQWPVNPGQDGAPTTFGTGGRGRGQRKGGIVGKDVQDR